MTKISTKNSKKTAQFFTGCIFNVIYTRPGADYDERFSIDSIKLSERKIFNSIESRESLRKKAEKWQAKWPRSIAPTGEQPAYKFHTTAIDVQGLNVDYQPIEGMEATIIL